MSTVLVGGDADSVGFDYSSVDEATANDAVDLAERIRRFHRLCTTTIMVLGRDLLAMKERLGHGSFGPWLEAEFGNKARTAQRYMLAAQEFGTKSDTVSDLPPATIYALAAPSTPAALRGEVLTRLEAGERLEPTAIGAMVREARAVAQAERERTKLTPDQKLKLDKADFRKERELEASRREWAERDVRVQQAIREAATLIVSKLGPDLPALVALLEAGGHTSLTLAIEEAIKSSSLPDLLTAYAEVQHSSAVS